MSISVGNRLVITNAAIIKAGVFPTGRSSHVSKGARPQAVWVSNPEVAKSWCAALPRCCVRYGTGISVSAPEAMAREILRILPTTFERSARLTLGDLPSAFVTLQKGQSLADLDARWRHNAEVCAKSVAIAKARRAAEVEADDADAVATFEALVQQAEADLAADAITQAERNALDLADPQRQMSVVERAAILAGLRNRYAELRYRIAQLTGE